jgi:hypothetical protein
MQIPLDIIARMLPVLHGSERFSDLPVTIRPMTTVWTALERCLLALRLPLYYRRLGKRPANQKSTDLAIQASFTLLAAFAFACGTKQVIVSSADGYTRSISFQPRPFGMNWTVRYAIYPAHLVHRDEPRRIVTVEDMLYLAAKLVHAISGHVMGEMPDGTATLQFFGDLTVPGLTAAYAVVRPRSGAASHASWRQ